MTESTTLISHKLNPSLFPLVDIAGNLTNKAFRGDLPAVLARAAEAGIRGIVIAGVSAPSSQQAIGLANANEHAEHKRPRLVTTAGIHPHHASTASPDVLRTIADLVPNPRVSAVGECGLDYNRNFSPRDAQRHAFEAQLEIAAGAGKPVYLHERDAHDEFLEIMKRWRPKLKAGVVHCFTGSRATLQAYLDLDLHIGITGWICDERRGTHLRDLVRLIPADRLMVETDCPYILPRDLPGHPKSGRNEPAFVAHVASTVAACREESFADLAASTTRTAAQLFSLAL
ncbi:Deoxyribonuclease TatD [Labilithrix luteola]|uniref:Deoxyribonuclease TatD n=1 Tax=Labilithrix luteola TaxID=1391654 RepID=A0A0K1PY07_9BACT|nr:TatD family hydrolase [Labilithrix luteola]AKU98251.1 Deoxyribonuclease TatD [Labilithrix luteola]